ncbi:SMI1/KNR4 family protein [Flavobacterium amniphilum]|uniref:SMI1/KNR4 family protein n=1 Tax=Flavobacterium amniphilum TaxID=1834035 RepID=UPI002029BB8A|nr:SMI1/KNR4 family protein [Flavobacterium amniphilum]MCL9804899.1 SMI1/KNR4 family protein [Flavobacterium amniphilum]
MKTLTEKFHVLQKLNEKTKTFIFQPCLNAVEIEKFESKFNISLPEDYKYTIKNLANGIYYNGLESLRVFEKMDPDNAFFLQDEYVWSEFPLDKRLYFGYPGQDIQKEEDEESWYPYETEYVNDSNPYNKGGTTYNTINILSTGCGGYDFIVVNGKEKGNIWCYNKLSNNDIYPLYNFEKNMKRISFGDWLLFTVEKLIDFEQKKITDNNP